MHHSSLSLHCRGCSDQISWDSFPEYNTVMVGNSGAIWMGAGSLTISRSRHPFRTAYVRFILIEHRYSLHSGLSYMHEPVLHFICRVYVQHVQRCSEQASRWNIQLSDRTGRLRWVTEQNQDGAKCGCDVLEGCSTRLSYILFCSKRKLHVFWECLN